MPGKELYQQISGLDSPWSVSEVELDQEQSQIRVNAEQPRGTKFCCPECQAELVCHDHTDERHWRYLDSCQFTLMFERFAIDVLLATQTVKVAMSLLNTNWDQKNLAFEEMLRDLWHHDDPSSATS